MHVQHERGERALQPGQRAGEDDEARAGELGRPLEVHEAERLADLEVLLGAAVPERLIAPAPDLDIGAFVGPAGHIVRRKVGNTCEQFVERGGEYLLVFLQYLGGVLQGRDLGDEGGGILASAAGGADLLRLSVALLLTLLEFGLQLAPTRIERDDPLRMCFYTAPGEACVERGTVLANPPGAEHDGAPCNPRIYIVNTSMRRMASGIELSP